MFFAPAFCAQPRCGERTRLACWRLRKLSRVANFSYVRSSQPRSADEVHFGAAPKPARETHALPNHRLRAPGLGGGLGRGLGVVWGLGVGVGLGGGVCVAGW